MVDEDHTMGEPINDAIQDLPEVAFSGFSKPDNLVRAGKLTITCDENKSPVDAFDKAITYLVKKFTHIKQELEKLYKKSKSK
jgi:DNA-directed RNA polymerase subunit L